MPDNTPPRRLLQKLLRPAQLATSRGIGVGLQLLLQFVVSALSGPSGLGVLQLFTSWSNVAGEVLSRGQPATVMRTISVEFHAGNRAGCRRVASDAATSILRLATPLVIGAVLLLSYLDTPLGEDAMWLAVMLAAPLFALGRVFAEGLKSSDAPLLALTLENCIVPAVVLLACLGVWLSQKSAGADFLLPAGIAGFALSAAATGWALMRTLGGQQESSASYPPLVDGREQRTFWASGLLTVVYTQLPFLIMPFFATVEEIGVFSVAHKLVNIITTLLLLQAAVFGPAFARESSNSGKRALLRRTQYLSVAVFTPIGLTLLLFSTPLARLFSLESDALSVFLGILLVGQFINAATGLPGVMMMMSGGAASELRSLLAACLLTALASPLLGHWYGPVGLACLFSGVIAFKNLFAYWLASQFLRQRMNP